VHGVNTHAVPPLQPQAAGYDRGIHPRQRHRLAEADLDPRQPRQDQSGPDRNLSAAEPGRLQGPRRPLRRPQHPREHAGTELVEVRPDRARHVLQRRPARLRHRNPYQPKEVATFVPPAPRMTKANSIQLNDVFVDEREIVYTVDRFTGGLYILEMDF